MAAKITRNRKIQFKKYDQEQVIQVPIDVSTLIPSEHLVRIINRVVDDIDMSVLEKYYTGGGRNPYHPKMLIKVWIYGYCERVYTSRRLVKAMRENIHFIWLSGNQHPCFKTLSEFRGERMQGMIDVIFKQVLLLLLESGYINLNELYVDGSKWEANANQYKKVWRANTERYKQQVVLRIESLLKEIKTLQAEEDAMYGNKDLRELGKGESLNIVLTSEEVSRHLINLHELVEKEGVKQDSTTHTKYKELSRIKKRLEKEHENLEKYEQQERILGDRNSYSQTDTDATMLRMKDSRLLPGYNTQAITSNQFAICYTIAPNASDSPTLPHVLDKLVEHLKGIRPIEKINLCADAGYGSEENYADLEKRKMIPYVKYPLWYQEVSGELAKKKFRRENWVYNAETDTYTCPNNRLLIFKAESIQISDNGYERILRHYECTSCDNCPFAADCKKSETSNRTVMHSPKGETYKAQAKALLETEKGKEMRSTRSIEIESTFGDIKYNMKHDRFILRGKEKVYVEYGLLCIGHNLRKVYCLKSGIWAAYYAQRAARRAKKASKRA
jgi:transposase